MQTSYIKRIKLFLFGHIINILLTELGRSVWENLDLGRWYRPHCVRSVLATSVKILPYRPPARLIRTNYNFLCEGKGDKIKRDTMIIGYEQGGLRPCLQAGRVTLLLGLP